MISEHICVVVIGRNEGQRLLECLRSILSKVNRIVYVDSGSADDSANNARSLGVDVVDLDMSLPFTAARARNVGAQRLVESGKAPKFIQFVDGDCTVAEQWFACALNVLQNNDDVAVVFGRRKERYPAKTIYNRVVDMEWDKTVGLSHACGGDSLMRTEAFLEISGFNPSLIAGEEPELCFRLRQKGWKILSLDCDMTMHDANITKFSQWWKRSVRCGYAYFEGYMMHGQSAERYRKRQVYSIFAWAFCLPAITIGLMPLTDGLSLAMVLAYFFLWYRVRNWRLTLNDRPAYASLYATATIIGKFAELQGIIQYINNRLGHKTAKLIEYK